MTKFLQTLNRDPSVLDLTPPVWLMRQAGRYLPEYRDLREQAGSFMDLALTPNLASEVTLQPLHRFDIDAAIIFSDILMVPYGLGMDVWFEAGEGPKLSGLDDISFDVYGIHDRLHLVYDAIHLTRQTLSSDKTLIGFAGAPWTVALYMLYGQGGFHEENVELLDHGRIRDVIDLLIPSTIAYLSEQITAGADVIKLFDSWAGLAPTDWLDDVVIAPARQIFAGIRDVHPEIPFIFFPRGLSQDALEHVMADMPVEALAIDQMTDISWAVSEFSDEYVLQGNLDPMTLLDGGPDLDAAVQDILSMTKGTHHIFNLGHGIDKHTPPDHVAQMINRIKNA